MTNLNKMRVKKENDLMKKVVFVVVLGMLFFPFYNNLFKTVDSPNFFKTFQDGNQSLVIARMALSDQKGFFHKAMFLGRCYPVPGECEGNDTHCAKLYQKEILFNKYPIEDYYLYKSHPGFHALFYSGIYKLLGSITPQKKLDIVYLITALINALIITYLITKLFFRYGYFIVFFVTLFSVLNVWLVCFGNELMMFIGLLFMPLLFLWSLYDGKLVEEIPYWKKILVVALSIILKCMFTGFEFISCSVLMVLVPLLFFAIKEKWSYKYLLKESLYVGIGVVGGMSLIFLLIAFQVKIAQNLSMSDGFNYLIERFVLRTSGHNEVSAERLEVLNILDLYINTFAIRQRWTGIDVPFKSIILCHVISSFILLIFKQHKVINITSWLAAVVSVSWLVLFRQHSAIHTHINPIIWYLPYLFFAYAVIGLSIKTLFIKSYGWMMKLTG